MSLYHLGSPANIRTRDSKIEAEMKNTLGFTDVCTIGIPYALAYRFKSAGFILLYTVLNPIIANYGWL